MKILHHLLLTTVFFSLSAMGQSNFQKYNSPTKFNPPKRSSQNNQKSATKLLKRNKYQQNKNKKETNISNSSKQTKYFGRNNQPMTFEKISKNNKYVNLNPETAFGPEIITSFDFKNTDLMKLTKHMQKLTGINLIFDKELKGNVTILTPTPITVGDAWRAYLTALNSNGYSLVPSGSFYKIVSKRNIRYTPTKIYTGKFTPTTENYVMTIFALKYISAAEIVRSFRPFTTRFGRITPIKQTNTVIIQDTGKNINRLTRLIKMVDIPGHEETLQIIQVKYSSAKEIASILDKILQPSKSSRIRSRVNSTKNTAVIKKIIAEPRTNTIIAMVNQLGGEQLRKLIHKLDVKGASSHGSQIHVHYLHYGDAETLAKTLQSLISGAKANKRKSRFARLASSSSSSSDAIFNSEVKIMADKANNALVVTASPTDFLTIKKVINKLDIPRDQVYVEGIIMETNISHSNSFGVNFLGAHGAGNVNRFGFGGNGDLAKLLSGQITNLGGFFAGGGLGKEITVPGPNGNITINTFNALISAVASNSKTNVLATPQILVLDNTEATFEVGEKIPYPKTTTSNNTTSVTTEYQDVKLKLKITPQINKVTRFIKLKIDQSFDDFSGRSLPKGLQSSGLATNSRSVQTTVFVRDRDTIAMGGLMRDKESVVVSKVPLLGDIPVLGWLFKNKTKTIDKINLLFFLTPRILANYQKDNAVNVQEILKRRAAHVKDSIDSNDPFAPTIRGLYKKAKLQEKGVLYDKDSAEKYLKSNNEDGIGVEQVTTKENSKNTVGSKDSVNVETPNYQEIYLKKQKALNSKKN